MTMQAALNTLLTPEQKERLAKAVRVRTSCRAFQGDITLQQRAELAYHAGRFALPGARLTLTSLPENAFTNITGCRMAAAVLVEGEGWLNRLNAGAIGEAFVLEATAMGLGTCWVGGSFRREAARGIAAPGETLLALIAVGPPVTPLTAPATRSRMAPDYLCRGNWRQWPEAYIRAATLVQQAPSGMNQQPWALLTTEAGDFAVEAQPGSALDAGIAILHAELALDAPHAWRFPDTAGVLRAVAEAR